MSHRKVGGIHFFRIGRLIFTFCIAKRKPAPKPLPTWHVHPFYLESPR